MVFPLGRLADSIMGINGDHADVLEKRGSQISREADGSAHRFAPQEERAHSVEEIVEPGEKGVSVCQTRSCGERREVSVSR